MNSEIGGFKHTFGIQVRPLSSSKIDPTISFTIGCVEHMDMKNFGYPAGIAQCSRKCVPNLFIHLEYRPSPSPKLLHCLTCVVSPQMPKKQGVRLDDVKTQWGTQCLFVIKGWYQPSLDPECLHSRFASGRIRAHLLQSDLNSLPKI